MLIPVSGMVILASVELSGELMQEIHQILHWNELEINLYFVLITIKSILNFLSPTLISYFFLAFKNFQNTYLTLNIHTSAK